MGLVLELELRLELGLRLGLGLGLGLCLAFLKDLCDNNEHQKLAENMGGKFDVRDCSRR